MNNSQAASQIFDEFKAHWETLTPAIPLSYEGKAFDPSTVSDKRAGWARFEFQPEPDGLIALGTRLLRQEARLRVLCSVQSNTGVLRCTGLADHAMLFFQRGSQGIRFSGIGIIRRGDTGTGWYELAAVATAQYDHVV